MPGIFISYRRDDSSAYAGRLYDWLSRHFGADYVFMDVAAIGAGVDFVATVKRTVSSCDVLVAVIGKRWLGGAAGRNRLKDDEDLVRLEVSSGLERRIRVIPVLVGGAELPNQQELPADLSRLLTRNYVRLGDASFERDVEELIADLGKAITESRHSWILVERRSASLDRDFCLRFPRTRDEVRIVGRMDEKQYGSESVSAEHLVEWWNAYRRGIYLFVKDNIVGALGMWPLSEHSFARLKRGEISDNSITREDICAGTGPFTRWYLADIIIDWDCDLKRGQGILLGEEALYRWSEGKNVPPGDRIVEVCGLAFSPEGANAMKKLGMNPLSSVRNSEHQVYYMAAPAAELRRRIEQRRSRRRGFRSMTA